MCNKMFDVPTLNHAVENVYLMGPGSLNNEKKRDSAKRIEIIRKYFQR